MSRAQVQGPPQDTVPNTPALCCMGTRTGAGSIFHPAACRMTMLRPFDVSSLAGFRPLRCEGPKSKPAAGGDLLELLLQQSAASQGAKQGSHSSPSTERPGLHDELKLEERGEEEAEAFSQKGSEEASLQRQLDVDYTTVRMQAQRLSRPRKSCCTSRHVQHGVTMTRTGLCKARRMRVARLCSICLLRLACQASKASLPAYPRLRLGHGEVAAGNTGSDLGWTGNVWEYHELWGTKDAQTHS